MKQKHTYLVISFFGYFITTAYTFYIGIYETLYSLGFYSAIAVQLFGLLIFGFALFLSKLNFRKSLKVFAIVVSSIQCVFIIGHELDQYKPTRVIHIPPNYKGCIYLFVTNQPKSNIIVDENGIGYIGSKGKATWEIKRGNESITEAFSTSNQNEILIRDSSNTSLIAYEVSCLEIGTLNNDPPRQYDSEIKPCMDSVEFLELVEYGIIDEKVLRKKVWKGNGDESSWVLDSQKSRL